MECLRVGRPDSLLASQTLEWHVSGRTVSGLANVETVPCRYLHLWAQSSISQRHPTRTGPTTKTVGKAKITNPSVRTLALHTPLFHPWVKIVGYGYTSLRMESVRPLDGVQTLTTSMFPRLQTSQVAGRGTVVRLVDSLVDGPKRPMNQVRLSCR